MASVIVFSPHNFLAQATEPSAWEGTPGLGTVGCGSDRVIQPNVQSQVFRSKLLDPPYCGLGSRNGASRSNVHNGRCPCRILGGAACSPPAIQQSQVRPPLCIHSVPIHHG